MTYTTQTMTYDITTEWTKTPGKSEYTREDGTTITKHPRIRQFWVITNPDGSIPVMTDYADPTKFYYSLAASGMSLREAQEVAETITASTPIWRA